MYGELTGYTGKKKTAYIWYEISILRFKVHISNHILYILIQLPCILTIYKAYNNSTEQNGSLNIDNM